MKYISNNLKLSLFLGIYFPPRTKPSVINLNNTNLKEMAHPLSISANDLLVDQNIFRNSHSGRPLSLIGFDINEGFEQELYGNINQEQDMSISDNSKDALKQSLFFKIKFLKMQ